MKKIELHYQILIALILAVIFGMIFKDKVIYISWIGDLFLRALRMIIVPLVFSSLVSGVANVGSSENLGRIGLKTMSFYFVTTLIAIMIGLFLVDFIRPGVGVDLGFSQKIEGLDAVNRPITETLMNIIPTNIISALAQGEMLAIIFFAILFGTYMNKAEEKNKIFLTDLFAAIFDVMMKITLFIIKFTPIGIFAIVARVIAEQASDLDALMNILTRLGLYAMTVSMALLIQGIIILPLFVKIFAKVSPIKFIKAMSTPLLTAFSTSSSNATLPLSMDAIENKVGVSRLISSFSLPLGATVNMNGTALYECVAAIFIAQAYGIELTVGQQLIVVLTALLSAVGSAGIPMAGLVMMTIVLSAVGLPLEGIGLILAVDRLLDMGRTTINVFGDMCGAVVVAKSEGESFKI